MSKPPLLVLGTHNKKKGEEMLALLEPHGFQLRTLADMPEPIEVEETGETFGENAALKATEQAIHLGLWVLAEDSGLSVPSLGGAPGVYSARYSGPDATDQANNEKLLAELGEKVGGDRAAFYVCHMTLSDPHGQVRADFGATCHGRIRTEPVGDGGFGYDPLFEVWEYHRTFGEMTGALKSVISHRARASKKMVKRLLQLSREGAFLPS